MFTPENTRGFTDAELAEMNKARWALIEGWLSEARAIEMRDMRKVEEAATDRIAAAWRPGMNAAALVAAATMS